MKQFRTKLKQTQNREIRLKEAFQSENGAIDLASIMVGIIVIGMIGGVIAATVFAVIPWTQDNAAKQQLDSIASAESAYKGLSSTTPPSLPAGLDGNSFGNSTELATANLLATGKTYCVTTPDDGSTYTAFSQSASGKIWSSSDKNTKPVLHIGVLPTDCQFITESFTGATPTTPAPEPYVDPQPKFTTFTFNCDTTRTVIVPMKTNLTGTETWSDGVTKTYSAAVAGTSRSLAAGVPYTMTFEGTYEAIDSSATTSTSALASCLRSVDHWGSETGVINGRNAFSGASNLVSVPEHIPPTLTNAFGMFNGATSLNDPNISKWNVSNLISMWSMFRDATSFNQPLNGWNVSNVTNMSSMFANAASFNQSLNDWNTTKVTTMAFMFDRASSYNQPLDKWDVSNVTDMNSMFRYATNFNQPLDKWVTTKLVYTRYMFENATSFNQPLNNWNVTTVTDMMHMFENATSFNQPLNNWNTERVRLMTAMFNGATAFNGDITTWNTWRVTNMEQMLLNTSSNRSLKHWNTVSLQYGSNFASPSFPTAYLPAGTSV